MRIKLNRALWGNDSGDTIKVDDERGLWAIKKGLAVKADPIKRKKKIDPESEGTKNKSCR